MLISEQDLARLLGDWQTGSGPAGAAGQRGSAPVIAGYVRLAGAVRTLLLDARLPAAARLPAERRLAARLGVSRTTVAGAYGLLRDEGFLTSRTGSGSYTALPPGRLRRFASWVPAVPDDADALDLAMASPEACEAVPEAVAAALDLLPAYLHGHGYDSYGLPVLREAIARRYARRGLPTEPGQIFVTGGAQHGFDLVLRCLIGPLDPVLVECPTYPNALDALGRARARIIPAGLGPDGWDIDLLVSALRQSLPRLGFLTPDFHNPTGHLMPAAGRQAIAEAAATAGTRLVIDETFAELRLPDPAGREPASPEAPLACWDPAGQVITIGSMSKAFWAGLRIGWVRADPALVAQLQATRAPSDLASPVLEQLASAWLLDRCDDLLPPRLELLARRRDVLAGAITARLPGWEFRLPRGGLSLWTRLDAPVSSALAWAGERHGLQLAPGPRFGPPGSYPPGGSLERYLRLPFTLPEPDLIDATVRLAATRASLADYPVSSSSPAWPGLV